MKPRETLIKTCIELSGEIIVAIATKDRLKEAKWFVNKVHKTFKSNSIDSLLTELDEHIIECKLRIATLLRPLLSPQGFYVSDKFWFSSKDLQHGYVWLYKGENAFISDYVLFLTSAEDFIGLKNIHAGEIRHIRECAHLLGKVPSVQPTNIAYPFSIRKLKKSKQNA